MSTPTKAMLIAHAAIDHAVIEELRAEVAALNAKLVVARTCYKELRASIHHVDAAPAATKSVAPMPIVTRYSDALGRVWIKTRVGNKASSVLAS